MISKKQTPFIISLVGLGLTFLATVTEGRVAFLGVMLIVAGTIGMGANKKIGLLKYLFSLLVLIVTILIVIELIIVQTGSENWGIQYSLAIIVFIVMAVLFGVTRVITKLKR